MTHDELAEAIRVMSEAAVRLDRQFLINKHTDPAELATAILGPAYRTPTNDDVGSDVEASNWKNLWTKGKLIAVVDHEYRYIITVPGCSYAGFRHARTTAPAPEPDTQQKKVRGLVEALKPFARDALCRTLGGNVQGDESPVFQREDAVLKLGDFRRAATALAALGEGGGG